MTDLGTGPARIEPLDAAGRSQALPAMMAAFWDYEETLHLLPSERARRRVLPRYLDSDLREAARFGTLLGARRDGEIVGAAAWLPPQGYPPSLLRQAAQALRLAPTLPWSLGTAREALRGRAENRRHHAGRGRHYFLMALGVRPQSQGEGQGRALVTPMLARADEEGVGCFLFTARRANALWYGRFGFEVTAEYRPTRTWPTVWEMWRPPSDAD